MGRSYIKPHFKNLATSGNTLQGFTAEINREAGRAENAGPYPAMMARHILLIRTDKRRDTRLEWTTNGSRRNRVFAGGDLILNPAGLLTRPQWTHHVDLEVLAIDATHLRSASDFEIGPAVELVPHYGFRDDLLAGLLRAMAQELQRPSPDSLYTESLANAAAQHLVRHYSSNDTPQRGLSGRLSLETLRQLHDYMHANMGRRIVLSELAALAGISTSHFTRLFRQSTGQAPHQRLMTLRLLSAEDLLRHSSHTIAEIATITGFSDQSHLTRLFHQNRGVTPHLFRRSL